MGNRIENTISIFGKDYGGADNWGLIKAITQGGAAYFGDNMDISDDVLIGGFNYASTYVYIRNHGGVDNW